MTLKPSCLCLPNVGMTGRGHHNRLCGARQRPKPRPTSFLLSSFHACSHIHSEVRRPWGCVSLHSKRERCATLFGLRHQVSQGQRDTCQSPWMWEKIKQNLKPGFINDSQVSPAATAGFCGDCEVSSLRCSGGQDSEGHSKLSYFVPGVSSVEETGA